MLAVFLEPFGRSAQLCELYVSNCRKSITQGARQHLEGWYVLGKGICCLFEEDVTLFFHLNQRIRQGQKSDKYKSENCSLSWDIFRQKSALAYFPSDFFAVSNTIKIKQTMQKLLERMQYLLYLYHLAWLVEGTERKASLHRNALDKRTKSICQKLRSVSDLSPFSCY